MSLVVASPRPLPLLLQRKNLQIQEGALYLWRKAGKAPKKWRTTGKRKKILRKTGKEKCAGNRKMTFLSHGKPESFKISAENGELFLKTAETGKVS